jgi:hypothetical protein
MRAAAAAGSVLNLRYNVVSLEGLSGFGQHVLRVRFRDNGAASQVRLNLRRYNQATGILTQVAAFDSNAYPAAVGLPDAPDLPGAQLGLHRGAVLHRSGADQERRRRAARGGDDPARAGELHSLKGRCGAGR